MEDVLIPREKEILKMSWARCQQERVRMRNEISFARGDETTGGPSSAARVGAYNRAIEIIEERLFWLATREAA
jgi:hypothetical protein